MTALILTATVAALICLIPARRAAGALREPRPSSAAMLPDPEDEMRERFENGCI